MPRKAPAPSLPDQKPLAALRARCDRLEFKKHDIACRLDDRGRYDLPLDKEFPFHIALHHIKSGNFTPTWNWHDRLELTFSLDRPARMRMGGESVDFAPGDVMIVDNLKLHNYEDIPALDTRIVAITFASEFIYSPGSPTCDYTFLLPFFTRREAHPHVLRASDELAPPVLSALTDLLGSYFDHKAGPHWQSACKINFLRVLYHLTCRFQSAEVLRSQFVQHRQQAERLTRLFDYIRHNYTERITVDHAAKLVYMSPSQFMKVFRKVAGMTLVAYLTRVRLGHAFRLLRETQLTIAEIATHTGFADQSYFDRRFKQAFNKSPRQFRKDLAREAESNSGQALP